MPERKKIIFVITKSNFGGAQRCVYDLATALPRERFDVAVAFGHADNGQAGRLSRLLIEKNIRTHVVPDLVRDIHLGADWRAFKNLVGLFKTERPDVVHAHSSKAGGLGVLAARLSGVPRIIFTIHGLPSDENRGMIARAAIAFFTWATVILSHRTIAISHDIFERVRKYPLCFRRVTLIYNGIGPIEYKTPADARKELRSIDPTLPEDGFVGTVAELHPNKDLVTLIDAIALLPDTHCAIIGDGELKEQLHTYATEKNVAKRVHFLGFIPDAAQYLRAFDAFVLTSIKEGLPYVLLEAGSANVPVVASDIPGVREIVLNNFTGLLVPPHARADVAAALTRLKTESALVHSLTNEMATRVQKTFSLRTMLEKTQALYE